MKDEQQATHQQVGLQTPSSCWHVWAKLKNSVFDVLFVLLDNSEDEESMFNIVFQTGVDYIQMMAFPFASVVIDVWNASDTLNGVTNFFTRFNVSTYLPGVSFDTFLALMYTLIFLIVIVISDIVYVAYSFSKKRFTFTFPLIFMAKVVPLFVTVLFLPIMQTLLQVVNCSTSDDGTKQVLSSFPDVVCWQGWHLFHTTITLLFSSLFVFVSCIVALALFEPRMTTNRLTARQNSTGQVVFIINKIICQFIFSFSPFQGSFPYSLLLFGLSAWLFSAYNITQPYYDKRASKFFRICSSYYFWTNLILIVSQLLNPIGFKDGLVIWICGMIFIGITIIFERKSNIDTLFSSSLKFKSGQELQSHLKYVLQLHHSRNEDKNSYMLLLGYIEKHIQLCLEEDCPLKYNKKKFTSGKEEEEYTCKQLLKQIQRMFDYGIKKYPQCTKLRLTFAFFYMQKQDNTTQAYKHFLKALSTEPSFGQQFIIYRFTKIISQKLQQNKQKNEDDLIQLIRFDNHVSLCEQGMQISSKLHKQFWLQLKQQSPILNRLNKIGAKIININQMIRQNYYQVVKLSADGLSIIGLQSSYTLYLYYISHQKDECGRLMQILNRKFQLKMRKEMKLEKYVHHDQLQELLNTKKCLVVTDVQQLNQGETSWSRIIQVNKYLVQLTKFQEKQLINKKLDKILPKALQSYHDLKICQWLNTYQSGNSNEQNEKNKELPHTMMEQGYVEKERVGYIKDSSDFIRKVRYKVHYFHQEFKFVTEIKPLQDDVLFCDSEGIIMEYTARLLSSMPGMDKLLSLQDLLGVGIVQELKQSERKSMNVTFNTMNKSKFKKKPEILQFQLQVLQIFFRSDQHQTSSKLNISQIFHHQTQILRKQLGIIASIRKLKHQTQSLMTFKSGVRSVNWQQHSKPNGPVRRTNMISTITWIIQSQYTGVRDIKQSRIKSLYSSQRRTGFSQYNEKSNIKQNLQKYENEEGIECTIKTYRYFQGQMMRLYFDNLFDESSDYDFEEKISDLQAKLSMEKMTDKNYQKSVKKALNTYIYHPQIKCLFFVALFLFACFLSLLFLSFSHYKNETLIDGLQNIKNTNVKLSDIKVLTSGLMEVLFESQFSEQSYKNLDTYVIRFGNNTQMVQSYTLENYSKTKINLTNALIRIQANLLKYIEIFNNNSIQSNITYVQQELETVYYSYITSVMERVTNALVANGLSINQTPYPFNILILYLGAIVVVAFLFIAAWIYTSLKINYKINGVLIWFLDVPLDYIGFSEKQCLHYSKISSDNQNKEHLLKTLQQQQKKKSSQKQKYKQEENDDEDKRQCEKTQSFKTRQLLISRYHKQSIIEYLTPKQSLKFVALFVMVGFLVFLLVIHENAQIRNQRVYELLSLYGKEYVWFSALPLVETIKLCKINNLTSWVIFSLPQLQLIQSQLFSNIIYNQNNGLKTFQTKIVQELNSDLGVLQEPIQFQYTSICNSASNITDCETILQGRLKGGYSILKQYIEGLKVFNQSNLVEIQRSLRVYAAPGLFEILSRIASNAEKQTLDEDFLISLVFYIYLVIIVSFMLVPWSLYLRSLNIKLNQTIQILNVIPIELIPVNRKATRELLRWIITQSSKIESDK